MLFYPAVLERKDLHAQPSGAPVTPLYPDDLLPALQSTLAALADVETRYGSREMVWRTALVQNSVLWALAEGGLSL